MFLNLLSEDKKILFRELDLYVAKTDGVLHEKEKNIINFHCNEMQIMNNNFENILSLKETVERISISFSDKEKRMVFLELLSVVMADEKYSKDEDNLIKEIAVTFNIDKESIDSAFNILLDLKNTYGKLSQFIEEV